VTALGYVLLGAEPHQDLGARVLRARLERGLTQAEVARLAGVSDGTVSRIETGAARSWASGRKVARALGLELCDAP
jgi:transcriptional regulator with XRE-family HTH domain